MIRFAIVLAVCSCVALKIALIKREIAVNMMFSAITISSGTLCLRWQQLGSEILRMSVYWVISLDTILRADHTCQFLPGGKHKN